MLTKQNICYLLARHFVDSRERENIQCQLASQLVAKHSMIIKRNQVLFVEVESLIIIREYDLLKRTAQAEESFQRRKFLFLKKLKQVTTQTQYILEKHWAGLGIQARIPIHTAYYEIIKQVFSTNTFVKIPHAMK